MLHKNKNIFSISFLCPTLYAVIFLCCFHGNMLGQQQAYFNNLTEKDGLSNNRVTCFYKDRTGYMWIGTESGLNLYNGNSWSIYKPNAEKKKYLSNGFITAVTQDKSGYIWVCTRKGLNRLDKAAGTTEVFLPGDAQSNTIPSDLVWDAYADSDTSIWIAADGKAFCHYNQKKKQFYYYDFRSQLRKNSGQTLTGYHSIYRILPKSAGELWLATTDGIFSFNKLTGQFTLQAAIALGDISFFYFDERINELYCVDRANTLYCYNALNKEIKTISLEQGIHKGKFIPPYKSDENNQLVPAAEGLAAINEKNEVLYFLPGNSGQENGLLPGKITCIYKDSQHITWVGSQHGISKFIPVLNKNLHLSFTNPLPLKPNLILNNFMYHPQGDEWLVASWKDNSVLVADNKTGIIKKLQQPAAYLHDTSYAFYAHNEDTVFMLSKGCVLTYNSRSKKWGKVALPPPFDKAIVTCLAIDAAGNYWMGNIRKELFIYNPNTKTIWAPGKDDICQHSTVCLATDLQNNCMWIGTTGYGLIKYDFSDKKFSYIETSDENKAAFHSYEINDVVPDGKGNVWVATFEGGLSKYQPSLGAETGITHYDIFSGLPDDNVYGVATDHNGGVWYTTINGIGHMDANGINKRLYNQQSGLPYSTFQQHVAVLADNKIAAVTDNNFICFDPSAITPAAEFPVMIDNIFVNDTIAVTADTRMGSKDFVYSQNALTFNFSVLDFVSPGAVEYFYMLEGLEKNWVPAGKQHSTRYSKLPPGEYSFKVKAKRENLGFYLQEASYRFRILPPYWRSWWFILVIATSAILLACLFVQLRIKSIRAVAAEKLKVQKLHADQYKNQLELEQIVNYFSSSLIDKNSVDEVLWDVAKNLIGRMGFEDCMIYLWNSDKTKMIQRAGYGPKGSIEEIQKQVFDVQMGQGVVGYVMQTKEPLIIADTSRDPRYRADEMVRLSEITVPIIYNNELVGIIDSEHQEKNFFTQQHVQVMSTIATLVATKINSIASEQSLQLAKMEMLGISEKLSAAKLEALRSQMNPHFIFNCLNSIDNLIQSNDKEGATLYLAKFAKLIRSILETSRTNTVPCWKDMETLKVYIELEALRLDNKFSYGIHIAPEILNGDYKVPPLVIQPFVENAIHHGLLNKISSNRELSIHVWAEGNYIHYSVTDNGVGRAKASAYKQLNRSEHVSMGMQISQERINLFNLYQEAVEIIDLYDGNDAPAGTKVAIKLVNQ